MDIISAIDQATGCHQCGTSLAGSVSDMFCGEACQQRWQASRVGAKPDHWLDFEAFATPAVASPLVVWIRPDTRAMADEFRRMSEAVAAMGCAMAVSAASVMEAMTALSESGKAHVAQRSMMEKALEARRSRGTGPASSNRAPRAINPRRAR